MRISRNFRNRQPDGVQTLGQKVAAILRKYGTDAHVYLPGIGVINGLTAGNYLDSAGTTAATVDNPVGLVLDAGGAIDASQATTANKPILRKGAVNLLTYSEQFDNAAWSKLRTQVTANQLESPFGTLTADLISTLTGATFGEQAVRVGATLTGKHTYSVYVKKNNWRYVHIRLINYSIFDFDTETFTLTGAGETVSVSKLANGWYRLSSTHETGGIAYYGTGPALNGTTVAWSVPVDGTSFYAIGAMLNTGTLADYIATTTAPASNLVGGYHWVSDSTDLLTATYPAGYESATIVNALSGGQSTLTAQNIVGAYSIGPSVDTYGRFIFKAGCTASELAIVQQYANRLAGV